MTERKECPRDCGFFGECDANDKRSCTRDWKKHFAAKTQGPRP